MKQFQFSLDRVLDFKTQMLDREKNALARLRREKQEAERAAEKCREEFQRVNDELAERSRKGVTVTEIFTYQYQLDGLRSELAHIQEEIDRLEEAIERQLDRVLLMSQDVSGLDKLKEHQKEDYDRLTAKAEENEIAEFVSGELIRKREA